jgi:hypothetical protein
MPEAANSAKIHLGAGPRYLWNFRSEATQKGFFMFKYIIKLWAILKIGQSKKHQFDKILTPISMLIINFNKHRICGILGLRLSLLAHQKNHF